MSARFLIAKYAPDLKRMEPRNVGVIVWSDGKTDSLFLGEDPETSNFIGVPRRIGLKDSENYRQWIQSWRRQLGRPVLELRKGEMIRRTSPDFVDGLREWSRANYMLVDGGVAESAKSADSLRALTVQLFRDVVADDSDEAKPERESNLLRSQSIDLWKSLGVWDRRDFRPDQPATYKIFGEKRTFTFDYAIGPSSSPYAVCHRVVLGHQRTFDSVFMNLEHYRQFRGWEKDRCAAIVLPSEVADTKRRKSNLRLLGHLATLVDLSTPRLARQAATEIAAKNGKP